jgi:hypothetical protein
MISARWMVAGSLLLASYHSRLITTRSGYFDSADGDDRLCKPVAEASVGWKLVAGCGWREHRRLARLRSVAPFKNGPPSPKATG